MTKFNKLNVSEKVGIGNKVTVNKAGGPAITLSDRMELATLLLTSFVDDKYYETASEQLKRLSSIFDRLNSNGDAKFAAKAAIYARHTMGMRSISQALSANIAAKVSGQDWTRSFFEKFPRRVDDMTELVSFFQSNFSTGKNKSGYPRALPNAMKYGLRNAFGKFNEYQLAKYRAEGKEVSLLDLVNILHPVPNDNNKIALNKLVNGTLTSTETWESQISNAGQVGENKEEVDELKGQAFDNLIRTKKIGYFALLKNLRNILQLSPESIDAAVEMLTDKKMIEKSLVFPFRFLDAYEAIQAEAVGGHSNKNVQKLYAGINKALELSFSNVPEFNGTNLIAVDSSGSMSGRPFRIAALFGVILLKQNPDSDFMLFDDDARYVKNVNLGDTTLSLVESLYKSQGGGTNLADVFVKANKKYDRVFIFSDCQSWMVADNYSNYYKGAVGTVKNTFAAYSKKYGKPRVYSIDLAGHGSAEFSSNDVSTVAGFSDKTITLLSRMEQDRNALVNTIEAVEL